MKHNLPVQLTSFVGRERELLEATRLLHETRLLTLTGAGGIGKTRLALQLAQQVFEGFADGAWLVELASLSDPTLVAPAMASALALPEQIDRWVEQSLTSHLAEREMLLVLDNCEHLLPGCARLVEQLLREARGLTILATSREVLNVPGELAWLVPGLAVDTPREDAEPAEAVRLFMERAKHVRTHMPDSPEQFKLAVEICGRLDGMPLAIELAAARVSSVSLSQIAERLMDRFGLLTSGRRNAVPRHQTLRALVDWSHDLLSDSERILLRRLAIFAGGWTLDAAEAICPGGGLERSGVLDLLSQLVDKSLVLATEDAGAMRYGMLETLRQYGAEKLREAGETDQLRSRHLSYFADLAVRLDPLLYRSDQAVWYDQLERDLDNLRAALDWSESDSQHLEAGLRLAGALWRFWFNRGHLTESWERLVRLLAKDAERRRTSPSSRALALNAAGRLGAFRCDLPATLTFLDEALVLYRQAGDVHGEAVALRNIGIACMYGGDIPRAEKSLDRSIELMRSLGAQALTHTSLLHRGWLAFFQDHEPVAAHCWQEGLELARQYEDGFTEANILVGLGHLSLRRHDIAASRVNFEQALLTHVRIGQLDTGAAGRMSEGLEGLACVAAAEGQFEHALRLNAGAAALHSTSSAVLPSMRRSEVDRYLEKALRAVGSRAVKAQAEGAAMTLQELVQLALAGSSVTAQTKPHPFEGGLTEREREIAALVAEGLSNHQIADRLIIADRTAETHVQHILNKLGYSSRAQIAAWAARHGVDAAPA